MLPLLAVSLCAVCSAGPQPGPDLGVECAMRSVAMDMSQRHPAARRHSDLIHKSLQMNKCPGTPAPSKSVDPPPCPDGRHWSACLAGRLQDSSSTFFVDCGSGDDSNAGTQKAPFATVAKAQVASRATGGGTTVFLRAGTCYVPETLQLTPADSGISYSSYQGEQVTFSAGAPLPSSLKWDAWSGATGAGAGKIMVADLPSAINASAIDSLFLVPAGAGSGSAAPPASATARRLTRARYPNGNSEVDRMPDNYDKLAGGKGQIATWEAADAHSERFPEIVRNSSFYPWFGHSNDIRWVLDYHTENESSYFKPPVSFWQSSVGSGAKYNKTTFSKNVAQWTNVDDAIVHVIHYDCTPRTPRQPLRSHRMLSSVGHQRWMIPCRVGQLAVEALGCGPRHPDDELCGGWVARCARGPRCEELLLLGEHTSGARYGDIASP